MNMTDTKSTPAAQWREKGEADPHGNQYDCERAALTLGTMTDDELANGAFLNYDRRPSIQDLLDGKGFMPIVWMTAVKERIRWLSRALVKTTETAPPPASTNRLTEGQINRALFAWFDSSNDPGGVESVESRFRARMRAAIIAATEQP